MRSRTIDGVVLELLDDDSVIAYGSKGDKYVVTLEGEGSQDSCQCLGWHHRKDCRHVRSARKLARIQAGIEDEPIAKAAGASRETNQQFIDRVEGELTVDAEVDLLMGDRKPR